MEKTVPITQWPSPPNRDEALERVFSFLKALSQGAPEQAAGLVGATNFPGFRKALDAALRERLSHTLEDEELAAYEDKDLSLQIDDPYGHDEDWMQPEFSGKNFLMEEGESLSIGLFLGGAMTPVRIHFSLAENGGQYFIKINRITDK